MFSHFGFIIFDMMNLMNLPGSIVQLGPFGNHVSIITCTMLV